MSLKVIANAGSGKTTFIINKIKSLLDKKDIIVFTFSKCSCLDILSRMKEPLCKVKTLHAFAYEICANHIQISKNINIRTIILKATELIKLNKLTFNFKHIFVDESQDLSQEQYDFVMLISQNCVERNPFEGFEIINDNGVRKVTNDGSETSNANVIMVGDINQCIYKFQNSNELLLKNFNGTLQVLNTNYRSTDEIIEFCNYLKPYPGNSVGTNKKGSLVNIHIINKFDLKKKIIELISEPYHDYAIISPVRKSGHANLGIYTVEKLMKDNKIPYQSYYTDYEFDTKEVTLKEDHINLLTIHNSKGLQFKNVILLNFHFTAFGRNPTKLDYENFKHMFYVGCSRAIESLHIICDKSKYIFPTFNLIPKNLYNLHLNGNKLKIVEKLKFEDNVISDVVTVSDFISKMPLSLYYDIEKLINMEYITEQLWEEKNINIEDVPANLIGIYLENIFNYYYDKNNYKPTYNDKKIEMWMKSIKESPEINIYKIISHIYVINEERIINDNYADIIIKLLYYIKKIKTYAESCKDLQLQQSIVLDFEKKKLVGVPDIMKSNNVICDIKFINNINTSVMQLFIYCVIKNTTDGEIWNFRGYKCLFKFSQDSLDKAKLCIDSWFWQETAGHE